MAREKQQNLPESGFVRISTILQYFPVSESAWWAGVREGRFPQPVKLGPMTTAWRAEDIWRLFEQVERKEAN